jgi:hypothetical protein
MTTKFFVKKPSKFVVAPSVISKSGRKGKQVQTEGVYEIFDQTSICTFLSFYGSNKIYNLFTQEVNYFNTFMDWQPFLVQSYNLLHSYADIFSLFQTDS